VAPIVTISYNELVSFDSDDPDDNLVLKVGESFGSNLNCLGILAVTDIPNFSSQRQALLPLASKLPALPDLDAVIRSETLFSTGWSHGKECLVPGRPDVAKGSFYGNPRTESFLKDLIARDGQAELWNKLAIQHPEFYADNVWPESLPILREAFKNMGQTLLHVGVLVAAVCDVYCHRHGVETHFRDTLLRSLNCTGRLLHYFDMSENNSKEKDAMWCGWHNDHGLLTGLVPGMYIDTTTGQPVACTDNSAGLYIQTRAGSVVKVTLPSNACGFQIGETSQIQSGGILQATPHAVRPSSQSSITRESFAVFLEPEFHEPLAIPSGKSVRDCQAQDVVLPANVVPLSQRWKPGQTFGDFHTATVSAFTI
jgi:isopenicillin N synthase-like dioxygenase